MTIILFGMTMILSTYTCFFPGDFPCLHGYRMHIYIVIIYTICMHSNLISMAMYPVYTTPDFTSIYGFICTICMNENFIFFYSVRCVFNFQRTSDTCTPHLPPPPQTCINTFTTPPSSLEEEEGQGGKSSRRFLKSMYSVRCVF